jgi:lysophospholipid acyltransferase (LPLAT)-like uncharacterized protein
VFKLLRFTMRFEIRGMDAVKPLMDSNEMLLWIFWHGRMLMMPALPRRKALRILTSKHRDGELISRMIGLLGVKSIRGSTTRGGVSAFRACKRALEKGYDVVLTPDGPKGPRYTVQPGIIELAKLNNVPIIPVTFSCTSGKVFSSWDRFMIPYPFSKGVYYYGQPFRIPSGSTRQQREVLRDRLEKYLQEMTKVVDVYCETGQWNGETLAQFEG